MTGRWLNSGTRIKNAILSKWYLTALFCALICAAAPKSDGCEKFVAFAGALAVSLTVLSPLADTAEKISGAKEALSGILSGESDDTGGSAEDAEALAKYYAMCASQSLSAMYGIDKDKISAAVTVTDGSIAEIVVRVNGTLLSSAEAEKRLGEILGIKVRVCDSGGKQ